MKDDAELEFSEGQRKGAAPRRVESALEGIYVGTAGWSIPRASAESFAGEGSHLERYSRVLSSAEINSTFYRSPRPTTYTRWATSVPDSFRFSLKAPKSLTHEARLDCTADQLSTFLGEARGLGEHLGPILFQLPPKLVFDQRRAGHFFSMLRKLYPGPTVVEPRHPSWFLPDADALLRELQVSRAAADPAVTPAAAVAGGHMDLVYFRLHGSPRRYYSSYSQEFLDQIAGAVRRTTGSRCAWCIFDNTASGAAAANALALSKELRPGRSG